MNNKVESKLTERQCQIISQLAQLLRDNGETILAGKTKLALTSTVLNCVNEGFSHIVDGDLDGSFEVLQTSNFKASVYQDLQFLYDFTQKTVGLKVTHGSTTLQGNVDISKFKSLQVLELKKIPVHLLIGLQSLTTQLKTIIISRCINSLEDLFLRCGGDMSDTYSWPELKVADISFNCIEELDPSLKLLPRIEALNLSHNFIRNTEHLEYLKDLLYLNLSYNVLENIPKLCSSTKTTLRYLALRNNNLETLEGLNELINLEDLDVSYNCLTQHKVLSPLRNLTKLFKIWLEGNPLSFHPKHRKLCLEYLSPEIIHEKFQLDGKGLSKSELQLKNFQIIEPKIIPAASNSQSKFCSKTTSINLGPNDIIVHAENIPSSYHNSSKFSDGPETHLSPSFSSESSFKKKKKKIREVNIADNEDSTEVELNKSAGEATAYHIQTKEKLEAFRRQRGSNWLVASKHEGIIKIDNISKETKQRTDSDICNISVQDNTLSESDTVKNNGVETLQTSFEVLHEETVESKPFNEKPDSCGSSETNESKEFEDPNYNGDVSSDESQVPPKVFSESSVLQESSSDDEQNKEGQTFIVQLQRENKNTLQILIVDNQFIKEKDFRDGRTLERLDLRSLLQVEKITNKDTSLLTLQLTFDYIRKDRRERTYIFNDDREGFEDFLKLLEPVLEARTLNDMMKGALQCLKCSAQFSKEVAKLKLQKNKKSMSGDSLKKDSTTDYLCEVPACPNCNSEMIVELDEVPVPKARGASGRSSSSSETTPHGSPRPSTVKTKKKASEQKSQSSSEVGLVCSVGKASSGCSVSKHSNDNSSGSTSLPYLGISPPQHSSTPSTGSGLIEWQQKRGQMELLMRQELFSVSSTVATNKVVVPKLEEKDYKDVQNNKLRKLTTDKVGELESSNTKYVSLTENVYLPSNFKAIDTVDTCGSSNNTNDSFYSALSKVIDTSDSALSNETKENQSSEDFQFVPTAFSGGMRRSESDITILSNPSQSSIAVISTPSVDQIGFDNTLEPITEAQKQFSVPSSPLGNQMYYTPSSPILERSLSVGDGQALLPKHTGISPNFHLKQMGFLQNSSSGSVTESVNSTCPNSSQSKASATTSDINKPEETSDYEDFETPRKNSDLSSKSSEKTLSNKSSEKTLSHHSSEKIEASVDNVTISKFKSLHNFLLSEAENDIQETNDNGSKINPIKSQTTQINLISYSYEDFTRVDHRIRLFLDMMIFEDDEEFASLLKARIIHSSKMTEFSGLLVISSKYIHLFKIEDGQISEEESDEPSKWLVSMEKKHLSETKEIKLLLSNQGFLLVFDSTLYMILLRDADRCNCYISYISGVLKESSVSIQTVAEEMLDNLKMELLDRNEDETFEIKLFIMGHWKAKNEDKELFEPILLLITDECIVLANENYQWLMAFSSSPANIPSLQIIQHQRIIDLVGVETFEDNSTELLLHFFNEDKREEYQWSLLMETDISLQTVITALRGPWETLFGVELTIIQS